MKRLVVFLSLATLCLSSIKGVSQTTFIASSYDYYKGGYVWSDLGNWTNGLPAPGNDATIPENLTVGIADDLLVDFVVDNHGTIKNDAIMCNKGTINNYGYFENFREVINFGEVNIVFDESASNMFGGGLFSNSAGVIKNYGTIQNDWRFLNTIGWIYNYGIFLNNAELSQSGFINNFGTFSNVGELPLPTGVINQCGVWEWSVPAYTITTENCENIGCSEESACNYDADATYQDGPYNGSCLFEGDCCDDADPSTDHEALDENCECTAVSEEDSVNDILPFCLIFPNPAKDELAIQVGGPITNASIRIVDSFGRVMLERDKQPIQEKAVLDLSSLRPGAYSVQMSCGFGRAAHQLIIEH